MNLIPNNQTNLYGLGKNLEQFISLYKRKNLPNKILLSGLKGIGKSTLAYHLINFVLSQNEEFSYNTDKYQINENNKNFKLIQNGSNPNFKLIDILPEKKNIDINQIRKLINFTNQSSLNYKPRLVLFDNIEFLNINSINALLKTLEEPNQNIYFILISNQKKVLSTLKSRCIEYKISLTNAESFVVLENILKDKSFNHINNDLINYYFTPGNIYRLIEFSRKYNINLSNINLRDLLITLIKNQLFATLDTTVRRLYIGNNNHILLSDTVGFIRNLPDNLIASFKSTLQEVVDSDLLLIVLDANSKDLFNEIETIKSVLKEIHADQIDYQYVFNKIDLVDQDKISYLKQTFPDSIMVSATRSLQVSDIKDTITEKYEKWINALKSPSHMQQ